MPKIKFRRGLEVNLPVFDEGEPGFTTDTEKFFIGSQMGNVQFAKQSDLNTTNANVAANTAQLSETVSLTNFPRNNGETDDTGRFTRAINALNANGGTLTVPFGSGTYTITSLPTITINNLRIVGIGKPTVQGSDITKLMFVFQNCTSLQIENIKIGYQTTPATRNDSVRPVGFWSCVGGNIHNIEVFNSPSTGLFFSDCERIVVEKNYIHDTMADGIYNQVARRDMKIINNTVVNSGDDSISFNVFKGNTITGEADNLSKRIIITGNTIKNSQRRAIEISGSKGAIISNNSIDNTNSYGIAVLWESAANGVTNNTDYSVTNNTILNAGQNNNTDGSTHAIYCAPFNNRGHVEGNTVYNAKGHGFWGRGNTIVKNNTFENCGQNGALLGDWGTDPGTSQANSYGEFTNNTIKLSILEGILVVPRETNQGWIINRNTLINCVDPANYGTNPTPVNISNSGGLHFIGNDIMDNRSGVTLTNGIKMSSTGGTVRDNHLQALSGFSGGLLTLSSSSPIRLVGTTSIGTGATSIVVTHNLGIIPSVVMLTPQGNIGNTWVTSNNPTNFTINCSAAPASATNIFWSLHL